jgi:hypothetical protein
MSLSGDIAGTLAVDVYQRGANAITLASTICDIAGVPLNEIQNAALMQAFMQAFDGTEAELASHLDVDAGLRTGQMGWLLGHDR